MNRAERRLLEKTNRLEYKAECKEKRAIGNKIIFDPCCYCNSKPLYVGDVIFLKPGFKTNLKYEKQLYNLIREGHRFVIIGHRGMRYGTCGIALLSTSQYLNEQKRLGIKLTSECNTTKDVYMDTYNIWIIDNDAIMQKDYSLNETDKLRCISLSFDSDFPVKNVKQGTYNSSKVDDQMEHYEFVLTQKVNEDMQYELNVASTKDFVNELTIEQLEELINKTDPEILQYVATQLKSIISMRGLKLDQHTTLKWLAGLCIYYDSALADYCKRRYYNG